MLSIIIVFLAIQCIIAEDLCNTGETYVRFYMVCKNWCNEQSLNILSGSDVLYTSPTYMSSEISDTNTCISTATNDQYSLSLSDSFGDSWTSGSYLTIYGEYGNVFFKGYLIDRYSETYSLSLFYPIKRYQVWKLTNQYTANWMQTSFQDSAWSDETMGSVTGSYSGTQYFRKSFTGVSGMVAYEVRMNYRFGVVAYVSGTEAFRDNMPSGTIGQTTAATGSYPESSMRGFIRLGSEIATNGVLAVEIHATSGETLTTVDFDAYLAAITSSIPEMNCFIYPYSVTFTSSVAASDLESIFDLDKSTSAFFSSFTEGTEIKYTMDSVSTPYINGFRYFINYSSSNINRGDMYGSTDNTNFNPLLSISGDYTTSNYNHYYSYWSGNMYKYYRLTISSSTDSDLSIYELMPLTCIISDIPTSFSFEQDSYTYYMNLEDVRIAPINVEVTGCSINSQQLPTGLTLDPDTCTITGYARTALPQTTFTVTSSSLSMSATFSLTINSCEGTVVTILRTYKYSASSEAFNVIDPDTEAVLYSVAISSGQPTATDVRENLCISIPRIGIDIFSSLDYWYTGSYLYVNTMLGTNEWDTLLRARFDNHLGLDASYFVSVNYPIHPSENWYYKMGEVPENWYSSDTSAWTEGTPGSFPTASNRVQLYKKTFSVSSLDNISGFVISVRYRYGIAIYVNNNQIFMNGITEVSTTATVTNTYSSLLFRQISFPVKTMAYDSVSSTSYLQTGSNTIAIALIADSDQAVNSTFNAALSLMGSNEYSRVFEFTASLSGSIQYQNSPFTFYFVDYAAGITCADNQIIITFNNDRREWISSLLVQSHYSEKGMFTRKFNVYGKNTADTEWVSLAQYTNLGWSLVGQTKKIWMINNNAYNQYKFENFGSGDESSCAWKISRIDMFSDNMNQNVPNLEYSTVVALKNVEMAEVYPSANLYRDFTVSPELPSGIKICSQSGVIYGTATAEVAAKDYTISAKKATTGESVSTTINFGVIPCAGDRSMITSKMRTDSYASECSYKLFKGRGDRGDLIASLDSAPSNNALLYLDRCLQNDIYTFYAYDSYGDGWYIPGGYMMTVDVGATIFDTKPVSPTNTPPSFVSTTFSSFRPFQLEDTEWKVLKAQTVDSSWTTVPFDDSTWESMRASAIGSSSYVTTYIRKSFDLPNLEDYQVLNVRLLYNGGIAAYFNGQLVARFNLEKDFTASSMALSEHDSTVYSAFHVILIMKGAVAGSNVVAFETHSPSSAASNIVFDATGIFGVDECSMVLDTYTDITGSDVASALALNDILDYDLLTYITFPGQLNQYINWSVENLEGTLFNKYGILSWTTLSTLQFSLMGHNEDTTTEETEYMNFASEVSASLNMRSISLFETPANIMPFKTFKWIIEDTPSNNIQMSSFLFYYCKTEGAICPGIDEYPAVGEGQISPALCEPGFKGYLYRECLNGQLSEPHRDKCIHKPPENLLYGSERYEFVLGTSQTTSVPTYTNIITQFTVDPELPSGLTLNPETGEISGIPTVELDVTAPAFTITGSNPLYVVRTTISIRIRKGHCLAEGLFVTTDVGETAVYECANQGSYIGTQKRACVLGAKDGEWQRITGVCISVPVVILLVVLVLIIIAVVIFVVVRIGRKKKAVGGVKSKKSMKKTPKADVKSAAKKNVKV